jgi:hypothetical protein
MAFSMALFPGHEFCAEEFRAAIGDDLGADGGAGGQNGIGAGEAARPGCVCGVVCSAVLAYTHWPPWMSCSTALKGMMSAFLFAVEWWESRQRTFTSSQGVSAGSS